MFDVRTLRMVLRDVLNAVQVLVRRLWRFIRGPAAAGPTVLGTIRTVLHRLTYQAPAAELRTASQPVARACGTENIRLLAYCLLYHVLFIIGTGIATNSVNSCCNSRSRHDNFIIIDLICIFGNSCPDCCF